VSGGKDGKALWAKETANSPTQFVGVRRF
jgi:hypothetical protein